MQARQFNLLAHELSHPIDALGLLTHALRNRTSGSEAGVILDAVELGLTEVRRQLASVLDLARAEHCMTAFDRSAVPLSALLSEQALQNHRVIYDTSARLSVVRTGAAVVSDRSALEVILRSVVVAGLHLARDGRVLVGARPRGSEIHLQVWATPAAGLPGSQTLQRNEKAWEAAALVIGIARALCQGLGHELGSRSLDGGGAMFSIVLPQATSGTPEVRPAKAAEERA